MYKPGQNGVYDEANEQQIGPYNFKDDLYDQQEAANNLILNSFIEDYGEKGLNYQNNNFRYQDLLDEDKEMEEMEKQGQEGEDEEEVVEVARLYGRSRQCGCPVRWIFSMAAARIQLKSRN